MKKEKIFVFIVFAALFMFIGNENVFASTSISVSSPSKNVVVGNTINITVALNSDKPLGCWDFLIEYDTNKLTLLENNNQKKMDCGNGTETKKSFSLKFKAKAEGTAKIYIDKGAMYSDDPLGEKFTELSSIGSTTITINEKTTAPTVTYSKNNYLSSLEIEGYELSPKFNKNTLEYTVSLPKETYNIKLNAKAEDSKSKISGLGDLTLVDGENKLEVKVTAENGNVKTYIVKAIVEEPNPIKVTIDGKEYTVVRKKDGINIPTNYRETTVDIQGESVLAFYGEITKYNLVALKDESSNIELYIYNPNDESYKIYKELKFNSINIYPYQLEENKIINGYEKSKMTINGMEVEVLDDKKNYPIVYGMNLNTGEVYYYTYDAKENTLQRYNSEVTSKLGKENKKFFYVSVGLGSLCILELMIMIIILAAKNNKNNKKLEETLEKTIKFKPIEESNNKNKKELKKEEKNRLKEEKQKLKEQKKQEKKQNKKQDMDTL